MNYGVEARPGSADNLVNYYASDAQLEDYKLIRSLVEKGIVSRDLQNDTVAADEKLKAGTAMMEIGHLDNLDRPLQRVGKRQGRGSLQG